jgi:plasmid stability protein
VSITVELPDDLAERLAAAAAAHGTTAERLAVEVIEARFPAPRRLSLVRIAASGTKGPTGRRHRELLRDNFADRSARET